MGGRGGGGAEWRGGRRGSVAGNEDSRGGSDQTNEDFYTISDRIAQWKFKFLGWKDMLCVMDGKNDYGHFYGPNGNLPDDVWSMRRMAAAQRGHSISRLEELCVLPAVSTSATPRLSAVVGRRSYPGRRRLPELLTAPSQPCVC